MANGLKADSMQKLANQAIGASPVIDHLIEGFLALGLVVGIAALGVVTARSVVERRPQIGVLRAIGFQRRTVQASLLLESSFIALTAIILGAALGLIVAQEVINASASTYAAGAGITLSLAVPWLTLGMIFLSVYLVASPPRSYPPAMQPASTQPKHSATSRRRLPGDRSTLARNQLARSPDASVPSAGCGVGAHFANIGWLDLKMMGVGFAAAILIDATIIRAVPIDCVAA